jgi:prepilin-type N-terminal cleavage/methylation domain-containing protein
MKQNNRGFSLVEIMIAAAMLGAISMGVMSLIQNMRKGEVISETKMEELELRRLITTLLTDQQACKNTFSGINIGSPVPNVKNGAGNTVYQKETPYGNNTLKITDMITKDTGTINSDLTRIVHFDVTIQKLKQMSGGTSKSFSIQLNVAAPGPTGAITGCSVDNNQIISAANLSSCASLNGNWDATTSKCTLNDYVKLAGDTMSGGLTTTTLNANKITAPQFCTELNCKSIGDLALANKDCTNKNEVQIGVKADGTPNCLQLKCGDNQYLRGVKADGTLDCITLPSKDCGTGSYVYNVNADGSFDCRPTPASWDADCGAGLVLQRVKSDGTKICVPKLTAKACNAGDFVSAVAADGSVACSTPANKVIGPCPIDQFLYQINADGTFLCRGLQTCSIATATYGYNCGVAAGFGTIEVQARCAGQTSCTIWVSNGVFGDPAGGCYKYLKVIYDNGDGSGLRTVTAAENTSLTLSCTTPAGSLFNKTFK